jgi:putative membrane protein
MNRALLVCVAAAALSVAACNRNQASNTASSAANTATDAAGAASNTVAQAGQTEPVNKAQDAAGAAVGKMSAATVGSRDTGAFVSNAVQGNTYEIDAARIAEKKSTNPAVKAFAARMIKDHTALGNEMKPLIAAAGLTPPAALNQRFNGLLDNLRAANAASFDKTYIDQQVAAHEETLTLMQGYAKNGSDPGLKGGAAKAVPIVQTHLDMARKLQTQLSAGT